MNHKELLCHCIEIFDTYSGSFLSPEDHLNDFLQQKVILYLHATVEVQLFTNTCIRQYRERPVVYHDHPWISDKLSGTNPIRQFCLPPDHYNCVTDVIWVIVCKFYLVKCSEIFMLIFVGISISLGSEWRWRNICVWGLLWSAEV